jgi:hypothetical protein
MVKPTKPVRPHGNPVPLKDHLRYWLGVACFYLRGILKLALMPLLLLVTFATGSYFQGGLFALSDMIMSWLLLAACISGLVFLPATMDA